MNRRVLAIVAVVLVVVGIFAMSSLFIVDQTEQALVLQLGQPRRVIRDPGLQVKRPFIENVIFYDKRLSISSRRRRRSSPPTKNGWSSIPTPATASPTRCCSIRPSIHRSGGARPAERAGQRQPAAGDRQCDLVGAVVGAARRDHAADSRRGGGSGETVWHRCDRCAYSPRRSAAGKQPGDLCPHAIRTAAASGAVSRRGCGGGAVGARQSRSRTDA